MNNSIEVALRSQGALQCDLEGLFYGSKEFSYRYRYKKTGWLEELRWSPWTKKTAHQFIIYFKRRGIEISIYDRNKRIDKGGKDE